MKQLFPNRYRGEQIAFINGKARHLRLTLHALAQLEAAYDNTDVLQLVQQFQRDGLKAKDVANIIRAGLAGADNPLAPQEEVEVAGGYRAAVQLALNLLDAAFAPAGKK